VRRARRSRGDDAKDTTRGADRIRSRGDRDARDGRFDGDYASSRAAFARNPRIDKGCRVSARPRRRRVRDRRASRAREIRRRGGSNVRRAARFDLDLDSIRFDSTRDARR